MYNDWNINIISGVRDMASHHVDLERQKKENKTSQKVMNFCFSRSGSVTVYVLIMSIETGKEWDLHGSHSLSLFPHLSVHSQTALAVQTLTLRHCHTPHWLPWRNSPPGLQGTRVYCLWLLYLDENMICWKRSSCFSCHCFSLLP